MYAPYTDYTYMTTDILISAGLVYIFTYTYACYIHMYLYMCNKRAVHRVDIPKESI